jgi:aerobic-type carbon monoxide dehydrogenase small subunit (CoxS/CutS family)
MRVPTGTASRIEHGVGRPTAVAIEVDGARVDAYPGESLAAALLAAGIRTFRRSRSGAPRGPVCNMGVCFECVVTVDGEPGVRACATTVCEGMRVRTAAGEAG